MHHLKVSAEKTRNFLIITRWQTVVFLNFSSYNISAQYLLIFDIKGAEDSNAHALPCS